MPVIKKTLEIPDLTLSDGAVIKFKYPTQAQYNQTYSDKVLDNYVNFIKFSVKDFAGFNDENGVEYKCEKLKKDSGEELSDITLKMLCHVTIDDEWLVKKLIEHIDKFVEFSAVEKKN